MTDVSSPPLVLYNTPVPLSHYMQTSKNNVESELLPIMLLGTSDSFCHTLI